MIPKKNGDGSVSADALRAEAFIGLGANTGEPVKKLTEAKLALASLPKTRLVRCSSIYCTAPVGFLAQPDFFNAVCQLETTLTVRELATALFQIERDLGRVRSGVRNAPRIIDLDFLYYTNTESQDADLSLPHPRLHERAFVLYPWRELTPDLILPGRGSVQALSERVQGQRAEPLDVVW